MAKLSKTFKEQKMQANGVFGEETRTVITVDYDPNSYSVEILCIQVETQKIICGPGEITYSPLTTTADVTDLLLDNCPSMEQDIMKMDWETEYREHQNIAA